MYQQIYLHNSPAAPASAKILKLNKYQGNKKKCKRWQENVVAQKIRKI